MKKIEPEAIPDKKLALKICHSERQRRIRSWSRRFFGRLHSLGITRFIYRAIPRLIYILRQLTGEDAYERYLAHHAEHHPDQSPLSRGDFFRQEQERKWDGV